MNSAEERLCEFALNGILFTPVSKEELTGVWTRFSDMHTGGFEKEPWDTIYIQASKKLAAHVFHSVFGHKPHAISCKCCGINYSIIETDGFSEWDEGTNVLFIKASDILEEWKDW
jgi:hypothetical protein